MYQQITIHTLKKQGKTIEEIAREMHCHRNTVRNILHRGIQEKQERERASSFDRYQTRILEFKKQGLTNLRIWQLLKDEYHIETGYDALCKYLQAIDPKKPPAFGVQTTLPGEDAEVDFGYAGIFLTSSGKRVKVWIFVMTLAFSRKAYYGIVLDQRIETFIQAHIAAFEYFGGVPQNVKLDNLKAAILKNSRYDLEFTERFLAFAYHYSFIIRPCTPFAPNQKGKVESGVGYVKKNFLAGRTFTDTSDLARGLTDWMNNTANTRIHGTTKQVPDVLFQEQEHQFLQPLPLTPFPMHPPVVRKVKPNCHIQYEEQYYSVPADYVGQMVDVWPDGNLLQIFSNTTLIATHVLTPGKGTYITNPTHLPENKIYSHTQFQQKYEDKFQAIGPAAHLFFKEVVSRERIMWQQTVKRVLGLVAVYGAAKVERAIERAISFHAYKYRAIKNICENNLENEDIEHPLIPVQKASNEIPQVQQENSLDRDLSYYTEGTGVQEAYQAAEESEKERTTKENNHMEIIFDTEFTMEHEKEAHTTQQQKAMEDIFVQE